MTMDNRAMAAALLGTRQLPAGLAELRERAGEAWAYHRLDPYPSYWFKDWKTEDRGPLPRCLPLARNIVRRGARWLFGRPFRVTCPGNTALEQMLAEWWDQNRMGARLVAIAERAALEGGAILKFSYDATRTPPLSIQSLSLTDQVRLYYHPHDRDTLLMARIQYPFTDQATGQSYWYREEWTADWEVHYAPVPADSLRRADPDQYEHWRETERTPNPFGAIPVAHLRNLETDDLWGAGDCWDLYRIIDRINLTYHLMDRSNQFDSQLNPIFVDLDVEPDDIDRPLQPGEPLDLHSSDPEGTRQGKVQFPPGGGNGLRPAMMEYAQDLRRQVLDATGSVFVDPRDVTNKGSLTTAVLTQLYGPLIEVTSEKRKSYGEHGIEPFLELVARSLSRMGVDLGVTEDPDTYRVELDWPRYFELTEEELAAATARLQEQVIAGFLPQDRAVEEVSHLEGRLDVQALKDELAKEPRPAPEATDPRLMGAERAQRMGAEVA